MKVRIVGGERFVAFLFKQDFGIRKDVFQARVHW